MKRPSLQIGVSKFTPKSFMISTENIRPGWKGLPGTNALAHLSAASVTKKKKLHLQHLSRLKISLALRLAAIKLERFPGQTFSAWSNNGELGQSQPEWGTFQALLYRVGSCCYLQILHQTEKAGEEQTI